MGNQAQMLVPEKAAGQSGKGTVAARAFANQLRDSLASSAPMPSFYRLPHKLILEVEKEFLGRTLDEHEVVAWEPRLSLLADVDYWLEHGRVTSDLMKAFAARHGANRTLYGQVGRIHDADYLRHPHKGSNPTPPVHPLPLALYLLRAGAHKAVCVAIMEHAGYIGLGRHFSTRLSAALSACDDLATYCAARDLEDIFARRELSEAALALVADVAPPRVRIDVDRACPQRVLNRPDLYINRSLEIASSGNFILDV